jgi:hypothetical protein
MMSGEQKVTKLPAAYTDQVIAKSNLLLRANLLEAQQQFDEAAELFAKAAAIEAKLAATEQQCGQREIALVHQISEMSCWAAAGDTYRALTQGQQVLALPSLTAAQRSHVSEFIQQLHQRRRTWMASWSYPVAATA